MNRYGKSDAWKTSPSSRQLQTYEGVRAMFEAYSRNKYQSTGVVQWMLNNAWPSMIWHLYDFYLRPGGGYFGAKRAMEPLHPRVWIRRPFHLAGQQPIPRRQRTEADHQDLQPRHVGEVLAGTSVDAAADSTDKSSPAGRVRTERTYFLALRLEDSTGKLVGSNFYWLSTKPETLDWAKSNWWMTPTSSYADFTAIAQLPKVKLSVTDRTERKGDDAVTHVTIENPSKSLAFFVRLKVDKGTKGGRNSSRRMAGQLHLTCFRERSGKSPLPTTLATWVRRRRWWKSADGWWSERIE